MCDFHTSQYQHILLIMISVNFYHPDIFHFVLRKKQQRSCDCLVLNYLIYYQYLTVMHLIKLLEDAICYWKDLWLIKKKKENI